MPNSVSKKLQRLWGEFKRKAFREAYVESHLATNIANQIAAMREDRGWTQTELAKEAGLKQSQISKLENPSQTGTNLKTLLKVAKAFDVALAARFVRYSDVAEWAVAPKRDNISVPPFSDDRIASATSFRLSMVTPSNAEPYFSWTADKEKEGAGFSVMQLAASSDTTMHRDFSAVSVRTSHKLN